MDSLRRPEGGFFSNNATLTLMNSTVCRNTSSWYDGGIFSEGGLVTLEGSTVSSNHGDLCGGICGHNSSLVLTNSVVSGNSGVCCAGGIYVDGGSLALTSSTVCGNTAVFVGGVWSESSGPITLQNSTVSGNASRYSAIGITGMFTATNCIVSGNSGNGIGGVSCAAPIEISTSAVVANTGYGIDIRCNPLQVKSSIVWNSQRQISSPIAAVVAFSNIDGGFPGTGNINADPQFPNMPSGSWTSDGQFDSSTWRIVLANANARWTPDKFKGLLINPDTSQHLQLPIVSNTATTITIWADSNQGSWINTGDTYQIYDYRLTSTSPCIDTGDPTSAPTGLDLYGNPRFLDGDLDRNMRVDMGAHEFSNVQLAITGNATPGGTIRFITTGKAGLPFALILGTAPGETLVSPFGAFFMDLSAPWMIPVIDTIPPSQAYTVTLPSVMPTPVTVYCQDLAIDLATGGGNTSNPVEVVIR